MQYTFESEDGGLPVSLWFDRTARAAEVILEQVVLQPNQIKPADAALQ